MPAASRLLALSEEMKRIASSLTQVGTRHTDPLAPRVWARDHNSSITVDEIDAVIRLRDRRSAYISRDLLGEIAWDMLLALLRAEVLQHRVWIADLCETVGVPGTTALRWLKLLEERGLISRQLDPLNRRRVFVELSEEANVNLRAWFADRRGEIA
jgi:DNA-binding MarR family transcriptional regulator